MLDHCRREAGKPGIKAILIYPMNALATDQAGRIAATIHRNPELRGRVTAGLFIGEDAKAGAAGDGDGAGAGDHGPGDPCSTSRRTSCSRTTRCWTTCWSGPRTSDSGRRNAPGALRYLVVDELHTFDGAQGTDLACLIRRLRVRLGAGEDLICVGDLGDARGGGAGGEAARLRVRRLSRRTSTRTPSWASRGRELTNSSAKA